MKKLILLLFLFTCSYTLQSQQLRYVDTDYILSKFPQYTQAQKRLEQQVSAWKSEIQKDQDKIDELQEQLANESVILTDDKIAEKEAEISSLKEKLNAKVEQKFGINGENTQLRINLVKPIQDQIWNAINTIAQKNKYGMIFDKAAGANLIYSDDKYDITDMVIKELGLDKVQNNSQPAPKPRINNNLKKSNSIQRAQSIEKTEEVRKTKN